MGNTFQFDRTETSSELQVVALPKTKTILRLLWLKHEKMQHQHVCLIDFLTCQLSPWKSPDSR